MAPYRNFPRDSAIERNVAEVKALSPSIPENVALGYHFCFGTLGGWPRFAPDDLGAAVELANAFVAASGRRVDWIHLPVLNRTDDAFFAPLKNLKPHGARVYLGMIHNMETFDQRLAIARKYLPDFGVGAYCGFGRLSPSRTAENTGRPPASGRTSVMGVRMSTMIHLVGSVPFRKLHRGVRAGGIAVRLAPVLSA